MATEKEFREAAEKGGVYEHVIGDRITEWQVGWLKNKRKENSIKEFLQQRGQG